MIKAVIYAFMYSLLIFSLPAKAWIVSTGKIESLLIYKQNQVLVKLKDNNGKSVAECSNKEYFSIPAEYTSESRNRMYSTLLAAKMADKTVSIAYTESGNCDVWGASTNVYRIITRIAF
ncbi:hypothetical protein L1D51_20580 [Pseudoalteromonas shioyasakiensis]|uniref:hypothetical protein n=1 Tax=Pseudoalteromonas shioyasakiensis TaxID=1190813 RepID=UPI001EFC4F96|nr:hypothetical protein [Pseudoalteromonas shioyasakiensis]MCG9736358.1 hypothetical protein [Pseudoalteromonas shioyasakiensis]